MSRERTVFEDKRSKRVVFVAHCILNQNAKIDACAHHPGAIPEVVGLLARSGCGVVQLECPELMHLGLDRGADPGSTRSVESEDTRVGRLMNDEAGRACCREIAARAVYQIDQYVRNGFMVVGMVGVNGSPSCGVEAGWAEGRETASPGVLVSELLAACHRRELNVPTIGIRAKDSTVSAETVGRLLGIA